MKVVEKMKKDNFQNCAPQFTCPFESQDELNKNATKDQLLILLSQFLSTTMGKMAACNTVGLKTFRDMYTKRHKSGSS